MDKFPEAFKRFEKDVDIKDLTQNEVIYQFMMWQEYSPTYKQQQAIKQIIKMEKQLIKMNKILRRGRYYNFYRNVKTGRFTRKG